MKTMNPNETVKFTVLQIACLALAVCTMIAGAAGLVLSFIFLASADMRDITAGTSGFVAGSVLIGSGLISLSLVSREARQQ